MQPTKVSVIFISLAALVIFQPSHAQEDPQEFLFAHNEARKAQGVGPLVWNETLAKYAQIYANKREIDCEEVPSNGPYGENLAATPNGDLDALGVVNIWSWEKFNYDPSSNTCAAGKICTHYVQMVSPDSIRLGCAKVRCNNGIGTFIGCNYDPPSKKIN